MSSIFDTYTEEDAQEIFEIEPHKLRTLTFKELNVNPMIVKLEKYQGKVLERENLSKLRSQPLLEASEKSTKTDWSQIKRMFGLLYQQFLDGPPLSVSTRQDLQKKISAKNLTILTLEDLTKVFEIILRKKMSRQPLRIPKSWNKQEIEFLVSLVIHYVNLHSLDCRTIDDVHWKVLTSVFPKALSQDDMKIKWLSLLKTDVSAHPWSREEDLLLVSVVEKYQIENLNWKKIAQEYNQKANKTLFRSKRQCKDRWINHLDQSFKKGDWTEQEDTRLMSLLLMYGKKWSTIAKIFGDRTENAVRNRWISLEKKISSESGDEKAEDQRPKFERLILQKLQKYHSFDLTLLKQRMNSSLSGQEGEMDLDSSLKWNSSQNGATLLSSPEGLESYTSRVSDLSQNLELKKPDENKQPPNFENAQQPNLGCFNNTLLTTGHPSKLPIQNQKDLIPSSGGRFIGLDTIRSTSLNDTEKLVGCSTQQPPLQRQSISDLPYSDTRGFDTTNSYQSQNHFSLKKNINAQIAPDNGGSLLGAPKFGAQQVRNYPSITNDLNQTPVCFPNTRHPPIINQIPMQNWKFSDANFLSSDAYQYKLSKVGQETHFGLVDFCNEKIQLLDEDATSYAKPLLGGKPLNDHYPPSPHPSMVQSYQRMNWHFRPEIQHVFPINQRPIFSNNYNMNTLSSQYIDNQKSNPND